MDHGCPLSPRRRAASAPQPNPSTACASAPQSLGGSVGSRHGASTQWQHHVQHPQSHQISERVWAVAMYRDCPKCSAHRLGYLQP